MSAAGRPPFRRAWLVTGEVQGVGFRPHVHRVASRVGLRGWVRNRGDAVEVLAEGEEGALAAFARALVEDAPGAARVRAVRRVEPVGLPGAEGGGFRILESAPRGGRVPLLGSDRVPCAACRRELRDPESRRHRYAFTCCTQCGPRWSITRELPWDRVRTSMDAFSPCGACRAEYEDPADRRFHFEGICCPACGPRLRWRGAEDLEEEAALEAAAGVLRGGGVVALRGLGGYQLLCDARRPRAVTRVRRLKARPAKPLAVLVGDLGAAASLAHLDEGERGVLGSASGPIVLARPRGGELAEEVREGSPWVGLLLPTTPLHELLVEAAGVPLVCTSGNRSGEPLLAAEHEAARLLGPGVDGLLDHDREIVRPLDDAVVWVDGGQPRVLRAGRGEAPRVFELPADGPPTLALGAHMKDAVALALGGQAILGPHIGDMESLACERRLEEQARGLPRVYGVTPARVACDLHPDYPTTRLAEALAAEWGAELVRVPHHLAHAGALAVEHSIEGPWTCWTWDGTGLGPDGSLWGGETLELDGPSAARRASLRPFPLLGGSAAVREPRRIALALLLDALGPEEALEEAGRWFREEEARVLLRLAGASHPGPRSSAVGRLLEGLGALLDAGAENRYEGQVAMALEALAGGREGAEALPWAVDEDERGLRILDWRPLVRAVVAARRAGEERGGVAAGVHATLVEWALASAPGDPDRPAGASGGCFQNRLLVRGLRARAAAQGRRTWFHARVPPNDGGVALGQLWASRLGVQLR